MTATAAPDDGSYFVSWSTDPAGTNVLSTSAVYTFSMPANDYTVYANFSDRTQTLFTEGYESRANGSLEMNQTNSPNYAINGNKATNPWFGADAPDVYVTTAINGVTPRTGAKMAYCYSANWNATCAVNLGYRLNNDYPFWGDVFMDWWFYDPNGTILGDRYRDCAGLCSFQRNPILGAQGANQDYNLSSSSYTSNKHFEAFTDQMLAIGSTGWRASTVTWNPNVYQVRVQGDPSSTYGDGWSDTSIARSVGWHHARVIVGPRNGGGTNDVSFYIDDMLNAAAVKDSTTTVGYNGLCTWARSNSGTALADAVDTGYFDDITFGTVPAVVNLIVSPSVDAVGSTTATWEGIGATSYELKLDDGSWQAASSPFVIDCSVLTYGSHAVMVRGLDGSGNAGLPASTAFSVDNSSIRNWDACGFYVAGGTDKSVGNVRFTGDQFQPDGTEPTMGSLPGLPAYNGKSWVFYASPTTTINFDLVWGANMTYGSNYLFTYVYNNGSAISDAHLTCASDDGIKVYFNGAVVHANDVYRGLVKDQDLSGAFTIDPGWNRLLVKETQGTGAESAQVRLCGADKSEPAWLSQLTLLTTDISGTISGPPSSAPATVTLNVSATDHLSGVSKMSFSNDQVTWSDPEPFAATKVWVLAPGPAGSRTCYARFTDNAGNVGAPCSTTINLTVANLALSLVSVPAGAGTLTGAGAYPQGTVVPVSATAKPGYTFTKWTSDQAGTQLVSSSASFNYTMPAADKTLYAQFTANNYTLTTIARPPAGGTVSGDHGTVAYNTACSVSAEANPGYHFVSWSSNSDGTGVVSTDATYAFNMPANDVTLYANFDQYLFRETFENLNTGDIDMNNSTGPNRGNNADLNGNPWWGTMPPDGSVGVVSGLTAHSGSKALWDGNSGNGRSYVNLAYRCNYGTAFIENVYADWWFYDRCGTAWDPATGNYCDDPVSLVYSDTIVGYQDYPTDAQTRNFSDADFGLKLSLGMADVWTPATAAPYDPYPGFDNTKYQARMLASDGEPEATGPGDPVPTPYAIGWYNLGLTRSVGWHHGRIVFGALNGAFLNDVSFYIDDMSTPVLTGAVPPLGINAIEFNTLWKNGGTDTTNIKYPKGAMYDDFVFGTPQTAPAAPVAAAASNIADTSVQWNWTEAGSADGFHVCDAATFGAQKGSVAATNFPETGLTSNAVCSRWVSSYVAPAPPFVTFDSARVALASVRTLATIPTADVNVTAPAPGAYGSTWDGFANPQGFGTDGLVSKFKYKWSTNAADTITEGQGTDWAADSLTAVPGDGTWYLYMRSYNADGIGNGSVKFGPYTFDTQPPTGSIVINNGDATTSSVDVTLTLSSPDATQMAFSNDNVTYTWPEDYATTKSWTLTSGDGEKTVYVKFLDAASNEAVYSDTIMLTSAELVAKISDLWPKSNGPGYKLTGKVVTGVVGNAFWIEEADRYAAIKVVWNGTMPVQGHAVDVTGVLDSSSGQRVLSASSVTDNGAATPIKALGVVEKSAGGAGVNADTPSITNGKGLYNVAMLVRIAGSVSNPNTADPNNKYLLSRRWKRTYGRRDTRNQGAVRNCNTSDFGHQDSNGSGWRDRRQAGARHPRRERHSVGAVYDGEYTCCGRAADYQPPGRFVRGSSIILQFP